MKFQEVFLRLYNNNLSDKQKELSKILNHEYPTYRKTDKLNGEISNDLKLKKGNLLLCYDGHPDDCIILCIFGGFLESHHIPFKMEYFKISNHKPSRRTHCHLTNIVRLK
jgi:hypothetical protein